MVHRSFRDAEFVGNDAMTLLGHYTKTRDRIESLAKRFFDRDDALRKAADDATRASQEAKDDLAPAPWHTQVMAEIAAVIKTLTTTTTTTTTTTGLGTEEEEDDEVSKKAGIRKVTVAALEATKEQRTGPTNDRAWTTRRGPSRRCLTTPLDYSSSRLP